jgi:hypothetical protein
LKIQHRQNFYAGLMFVLFGVTAMVLSRRTLDIGSAADMGPGFFPYYLGAVLSLMGAVLCATALRVRGGDSTPVSARPFLIFLAMIGMAVVANMLGLSNRASVAAGVLAGCVLAVATGERTMGLLLGAVALFGLLVKGLGLVLSVALLLVIAALASHESKVREVAASIVALSLLAVAVFLYGLNLQMPVWPDTEELTNIFTPAKKR